MNREMSLTIDPDGTGHCLYNELIDLRAIGTIECRRASHIEFDGDTQRWRVLSADGRHVLFCHRSRSRCEAWEHRHLQPC